METNGKPLRHTVIDPSMQRLDSRISALEVKNADVGAVLVKARFKLFKTYTAEDMRLLEKIVEPRSTLVC